MEYHYKAFISYRHAEHDTKVAVEIQNRLERYHIPGSIRREYGIKNIGRIFRDKDELPSTSDLNDNIKEAIASSEFLICICSPNYIESVWCRKEIEFFLESHDKSHVLTVLAEGDPYKVVPEILCKETVTVQDEEGNDVTVEVPLEPLSCDWRMDRHRARTEELPRLAAVLIGCRYAELRQKMRRRQMRLIAAASAAGAALMAYFVWSYFNIQNNYRQALINQSEYLAASAAEALDANDNLLAAQLSLAALPGSGIDRPIVPKALYTLSKAVGAYQTNDITNFRGTASYTMSAGSLYSYKISPDAAYLAMTNGSATLAIWDLLTDTRIAYLSTADLAGDYASDLTGHGKEQFVLWSIYGKDVAMMRYSDGAILWHQKFTDAVHNVVSLGEEEDAPLMILTEKEMLIVDARSGEAFKRLNIGKLSGGEAAKFYQKSSFSDRGLFAVCPESGCICIAAGNEKDYSTTDLTGFLTYFYETGSCIWTPYKAEPYCADGLSRDEAGRILLAYTAEEKDKVLNFYWQSSYESANASFGLGRENILLLEEGSGKILWENVLTYQGMRETSYVYQDLRVVPGEDGYPDKECAVAGTSNEIVLYDIDTGETAKEVNLSDWIVSVEPQDPDESYIRVNGYSGTQYVFKYFETGYTGLQFMDEGMDDAVFLRGKNAASGYTQFVVRQGNTIRIFQGGQGDKDWKAFDCESPDSSVTKSYIIGTTFIALDTERKLYAYDLSAGSNLWKTELEVDGVYDILGASADGTSLYLHTHNEEAVLFRVTVSDGTVERVSLTENDDFTGAGRWHFDTYDCIASGNYVFYRATNYDTGSSFWFRFSMNDESLTYLKMPYYTDSSSMASSNRFLFAEDGSKAIILENDAGYLADFGAGKVSQFKDPYPAPERSAYQDKGGMFALWNSEDNLVRVYAADGAEAWTVSLSPDKVSYLVFYGEDLYVSTENKYLYRYRARDGEPYGLIELGFQMWSGSSGFVDAGNDQLIVGSGTGNLKMIDLPGWTVTGEASGILGYCSETRQFISIANSGDTKALGACPYYSPEELIEKGKRFVGDHTLTDAQRTAYGLN